MIGVGLTEAESLTLSSNYSIENRGSASGGQAIRILDAEGTQGTASGAFTGPDGSYDIDVSYFNENDGEATYEVLVNDVVVATWTGVGGIQNLTRETERVTLDLVTGDVITLRGTVGGGELARFDAIEITEVADTDPVDPPTMPGATIGLGTTEAEDLELVTYTVENRGSASGGQTIRMVEPDGTQGTAAGEFTGADGSYDIDVTYFNENDGEATFELLVNGVVAATWTGAGGTGGAVSTIESVTLDLETGDIITLRGTVGDGELARFDKIDISQASGGGGPVDPPPTSDGTFIVGTTEAEDLDLVTYTVENRGSASGGQTIRMLQPDGTQGTATGTFTGADGTYDLDITYFNENDGEATFEVLVNGVVAATWTGAGGTSGAVSMVESITLDLETDDVIALRGTVGDGELARFDKVDISENDGTPPAPGATIGLGTTEAESLELVTYTTANSATSSGGQIIQIFDVDGTQGTASGGFSGPNGNYNIAVTYLDESDGVGAYEVLVNGVVAFSWTGDAGGGGLGTPTEESGIVALQTDDVITIRGTVGNGEAVRIDKIDVTVVPDAMIGAGLTEAEDLDLVDNFQVENRSTASSGQLIRLSNGPDGTTGTAAGVFTGVAGSYTMDVTYFDESDGVSTFEVLVNNEVAFSWLGDGGTRGAGSPEMETGVLSLNTGDVISLRSTWDAGEIGRFDAFELTANEIDPNLATFGLGATEAETLDLVTYAVADVATASGGQIVQIFAADGTQGTASGIFTGMAGNYDVSVTYLDEIDGVGTYEVLVNDVVAFSWTGDAGGGGVGTPTIETGTVALETGDTITIRGTVGDGEAVRLDKIDILPAPPSPDTLDLSGTSSAHIVDLGNEFLAEAARILLLGDSLTEGAAIDGGYRAPLFELLTYDLGLWVDFVGGRTTNPVDGLLDLDHQGQGGITATTVNNNITTIASANPADFALVMLGTNDVLQETNPQSSVPGELLNILQELDAANGDIEVLLGQLPPTIRDGGSVEIPAINALLPGVVSDAITAGVDASLVDFSNVTSADYYDDLHPDTDGVVKFAQNWLVGLQAAAAIAGGTFEGTESALSTDVTTVIGGLNNDRLTGDAAANTLDGQGGNDWIEGAGGDDILTGGLGVDLFVFNDDAGLDTITDFDTGTDLIDLRDHSGATDFAGLDITDVAGDATVRVTGITDLDTITLTGVSAGSLDADDFIFDTLFI